MFLLSVLCQVKQLLQWLSTSLKAKAKVLRTESLDFPDLFSAYHPWIGQPGHTGLPAVRSCLKDFALAVPSAWHILPLGPPVAASFSPHGSQQTQHLLLLLPNPPHMYPSSPKLGQ